MKTTNVIKDRIVETVHKLKSTFTVSLFVPPHPPRTESKGWEELARKLKKEDVACRVCGVRDSTMSDPKQNPYGATQIELHHKVVEWSWKTIADQNKVAIDFPEVSKMDAVTFQDWLDHGQDAVIPYCDIHHRHKLRGIHSVPAPDFNLELYKENDFKLVNTKP